MNNKLIGALCVAAMAMGLGMAQTVFASGTAASCEQTCYNKYKNCPSYKCMDLLDSCLSNCD